MNRRVFIKNTGLGTLGVMTVPSLMSMKSEDVVKVTILHTNDTHSHIDPFPSNHSKYPNRGGVQNRLNLINAIRAAEKNVLLLDAGDIFQGTPYFNMFGGELELKLMSKMGYDAATMGNHDFDNGLDGFDKVKQHAKFPFLCANYDFSNTVLHGFTKPYKVFKKQGIKIGVFGVGVELDGLVSKKNYLETQYLDPVKKANEVAKKLRGAEKCDLVICLSHLGYDYETSKIGDLALAKNTAHIDLIIGGHTHTFLEAPSEVNNAEGKRVLVNQVGWAGLNVGRVDFIFTNRKIDALKAELVSIKEHV